MVQMIEEDYVGPLYWKTVTLEIFHEGIASWTLFIPSGDKQWGGETEGRGGGERKILVRSQKQLPEPP